MARWRSFSRLPFNSVAFTSLAPHAVCGSDGRGHTADGSGLLLDQERAAGLRRVLAGHVHREHVLHALRLLGMRASATARLPRFSSPQMNVSVRPGGGSAFAAIAFCSATRQRQQRPAPAAIVVRAGLLDVRDHDDALVGLDGAGNLGDERSGSDRRRTSTRTSTFTRDGPFFRRSRIFAAARRLALKPNALAVSS